MQAYRDEFAAHCLTAGFRAEWRGPGDAVVLVPLIYCYGAETVCRDIAEAAAYVAATGDPSIAWPRLSTINHASGNLTMTSDQKASLRDRQVGGDHYRRMKIQPWDALEAWFTPGELQAYLLGTAIAYLARAGHKGPVRDDIAKAVHTLERLLESLDAKKEGHPCDDSKT